MPTNVETFIFYFLNKTCHSFILDDIMLMVTKIGSGQFLFVIALAMLVFNRKHPRLCGLLMLAGATFSYQASHLIKNIVARPRPFLELANVSILTSADGFSFPSTHATMIFMAATILTKYFGKGVLFYLIAALVAGSRVYLGVHFPTDVIVGGCIGVVIGYFLIYIAQNTKSDSP